MKIAKSVFFEIFIYFKASQYSFYEIILRILNQLNQLWYHAFLLEIDMAMETVSR